MKEKFPGKFQTMVMLIALFAVIVIVHFEALDVGNRTMTLSQRIDSLEIQPPIHETAYVYSDSITPVILEKIKYLKDKIITTNNRVSSFTDDFYDWEWNMFAYADSLLDSLWADSLFLAKLSNHLDVGLIVEPKRKSRKYRYK